MADSDLYDSLVEIPLKGETESELKKETSDEPKEPIISDGPDESEEPIADGPDESEEPIADEPIVADGPDDAGESNEPDDSIVADGPDDADGSNEPDDKGSEQGSEKVSEQGSDDGIPIIEDEDYDGGLEDELEDREEVMIQDEKDKLLEFKTDFDIDDLLLIIFYDRNHYEDYLGKITEIQEDYIVINDEKNIYYSEGYIQLLHKDYTIIDITVVAEVHFDILEKDEVFKEEKIELDVLEKDRKEKIFTDTEIKEDFISSIIKLYNVYDSEVLVKNITEMAYTFIDLVEQNKSRTDIDDQDILKFIKDLIKTNDLNLPSFILPIVGMKKKLYDDMLGTLTESEDTVITTTEEELVRKYNLLNETDDFSSKEYINYMNNLFSDEFESYLNNPYKFGTHINHNGLVIRDCLDDISPCNSINKPYTYDVLKIRNNLEKIYNSESELIVENRDINIIGFLFIPIDNINHIKNMNLYDEIYNLNDIINFTKGKDLKNIFKNNPIKSFDITNDSEKGRYEQYITKYLFKVDKHLSYDEFKEMLVKNFPTNSDIIDSLNVSIEEESLYLFDLFYNYSDIEKVLNLLDISLNDINYDKKIELGKMIEINVKSYITQYTKLLKKYIKPIKLLKKITKQLDSKEKIKLCQELIFSQTDLIYRHSLLGKFISIYGREANKESEDKSFYYNINTDSEKLICKHYLYLIKNDKSSFDVLKSLYGEPNKDGNIYCKKCHRFICNDEFSTFEGFHEGKPTTSKEAVEEIEEMIDLDKKEIKETYEFIKYISEKFNIDIKNDDMIKIINLYLLINHKNLYDYRYEDDILKTHPFMKGIQSKGKTDSLKEFLCNINNILSAIFLIFIQIQISNNNYNINFNNRINLVNSNDSWKNLYISDSQDSINLKVVTYIEAKLKSLVKKYPKEKVFSYVEELFNESEMFKLLSFKDHFINVIRYWMNPQYNLYSHLEKYFLFESGINKDYINDYWITYKPLYDNKLIKHINDFVQSQNGTNKKFFVNNNSLQNISLLTSINNDEPKYQELSIQLSELMNNPSYKRLYMYALKGYGKSPVFPILNLLTTQFLNTFTPSGKKGLIPLLNKCHFNHEKGEYSSINYNLIKKVFLDDIIKLEIHKDSDNIRKFQYINLNNQEYFLLNSNVIHHYSYTPANVYIMDSYDQLLDNSSPILEKMFKYYCLDRNDKLIPNQVKEIDGEIINTNIINSFLLDFNEELIENISECGKEIPKVEEYFHRILNYLIDKNQLSLPHQFISYTESYSNDYIINHLNKDTLTETRLLDFLDDYCEEGDVVYEQFNNFKDLLELVIYKKNNDVIDKSEISGQFEIILRSIISNNKTYMNNIDSLFNKLIENDMYSQFNNLQQERLSFKLNKQKQTDLEQDIGFIPETNIPFFINNIMKKLNNKLVSDRMINNMFYYISFLKNVPNGDFNPIIKDGKEWKMSESKIAYIGEYLQTNTFLLHDDMFLRNKMKDFETGRKYSGFNEYREKDYHIYFEGLYNHINRYRTEIYKLKTDNSIFKESQLEIFNKYIFLFIINKIVEYIQLLLDDTSNEYIQSKRKCDLNDNQDITIKNNIIILSRFLLDTIVNINDKLYDLNWIYIDKETYKNKLDEHNAREKQQNLDKLDNMTDDKRRLYSVNQKITSGIMYKESEGENLQRRMGGDRDQQLIEERIEKRKAQHEENVNSVEETDNGVLQEQEQDEIEGEDEGYYNTDDFAADGEEHEDDLDALQHNSE